MFADFRQTVKRLSKDMGYTYAQMARITGVKESTIKGFMCGASDSRRIAEKLADVLGVKLVYSNGEYSVIAEAEKDEEII